MDEKQLVSQALSAAIDGVLGVEQIAAIIEKPKSSDLGDLAFPAFQLAKTLRKSPQIIAGEIAEKIDTKGFEKVIAVGPYVNFFLDKGKVSHQVIETVLTEEEHFGDNHQGEDRVVTIDMSSPNIAKPMSMGHLRSTVIGNSIAKILTKNGYKPIKDNHLGDWGTQFGKLITAYLKWGSEEDVKRDPIHYLVQYYIRFLLV